MEKHTKLNVSLDSLKFVFILRDNLLSVGGQKKKDNFYRTHTLKKINGINGIRGLQNIKHMTIIPSFPLNFILKSGLGDNILSREV